jgi:hypothetical protein
MEKATYWPTELREDDALFAGVESKSSEVKYLVFSSKEKGRVYIRADKTWLPLAEDDSDTLDDLDVYPVTIDFIEVFDKNEEKDASTSSSEAEKYEPNRSIVAAAADCPPATQDVSLNIKNRQNAIDAAGYGPLNPAEPNEEFWDKKADRWSVTIEDAKKSLCGNCAVFIVTSKMKECIRQGLEGPESNVAYNFSEWDQIDEASELGYCEAFDFKCAAARTCDAWVSGGPIVDTVEEESE